MYEEHFNRKTVSLLKCECPLLEHGCKWVGSLENCEKHLDKCTTSMRRVNYTVVWCCHMVTMRLIRKILVHSMSSNVITICAGSKVYSLNLFRCSINLSHYK